MTGGRMTAAAVDRVRRASRGGQKGGRMGGLGVHPWTAARSRQRWVFAGPASPTTRPPRRRFGGVGAGSRARGLLCLGAGGGGLSKFGDAGTGSDELVDF
jgi:hypothetical protein